MKNVKAKVLAALVAAAILVPAASVYAEGNTSTASKDKLINTISAINKNKEKLEKIKTNTEDKITLSEKKLEIKQAQVTNSELRKEIAAKKTTIDNLKKEISKKKTQLSSADKEKIQVQLKVVKTQLDSLKNTKGSIKEDLTNIKAAVKDKNFDAAKSELDSILATQNLRTDNLKAISSSMNTLINIMQAALTNAAPVSTN